MIIKFTIPGKPIGKGRPRFTRRGNYVTTYTPKATSDYEEYVRLMYRQAHPGIMLSGAIKATINAYFPIPKSVSKKARELMETETVHHVKKPDGDNIAKTVFDSVNGIAYRDDSQICSLHIDKKYSGNPRVEVILEELGDDERAKCG